LEKRLKGNRSIDANDNGCDFFNYLNAGANEIVRIDMKYQHVLSLLTLGCCVLSSGCASAIYASGKHGDVLRQGTDRQVIVERLGEPVDRSVDKFGRDYEVFRAKGKVAPDEADVNALCFGEVMTFGILEPYYLAVQLVSWPFLAAGDKDVGVGFDQAGKYLYHNVHRAKRRDK